MSVTKKFSMLFIALALIFVQSAAWVQPAFAASEAANSAATVRVRATSVQEDKYVTLAGSNLVVNTRYSIYLSKTKTYSSKSILVGSVTTDAKGAFTKTFRIPGKLVDVVRINIYITNGRNDTASNWFINASSSNNTGGESAAPFSFTVTSVKRDTTVKIKTSNLPPNVTFTVYIGKAGSQAVKGVKVGTLVDEDGGSVKFTFEIPDSLEGKKQLDIRIENKKLGIVVYKTFDN
jgi:hypothetical protein